MGIVIVADCSEGGPFEGVTHREETEQEKQARERALAEHAAAMGKHEREQTAVAEAKAEICQLALSPKP